MRRRLDLAASMILAPAVLFLDEPTTGLDPRSRIEVVVAERSGIPRAVKVVARVADGEPGSDETESRVHAPVTDRVAALTEVARTLQDEGVRVEDIGLRRPGLDDVFLRLTGHRTDVARTKEEAA
ncbi:hypothetical protein GCM10019016_127860 [Streptomyces prasinosporus]|uniref:DUF4162 domain-containing protein n=1 Tax=Streptomyces prasinosporus TaxID=68256 RepID=A0ABP6UFZ1_9ACTN